MAHAVVFNSTDDDVIIIDSSADTNEYQKSTPQVGCNADLSAVTGIPQRYWNLVGGQVQAMTQGERDAKDAAEAAATLAFLRTAAKGRMTSSTDIDWRAVAGILVDEINVLRQWLASFKVEVVAASNLADLKTRVAGLPATPDRTLAQAKTAYQNKVDSGAAD